MQHAQEPRRRLASQWTGFPVEIWDEILSFVPPTQLQRTTHSLVLAFPRCNVSRAHMFRHIVIAKDEQIVRLRNRLAEMGRDGRAQDEVEGGPVALEGHRMGVARVTRTLRAKGWRWKDNNVVLNLIRAFGHLRALELWVGPVFGVDQLEELFLSPWGRLETLSLRFNQYVNRRSYEPFLRGAYFDSSIQYLSSWPASPRFRSFSFVQDPPPLYNPTGTSHDGIAQPIVLFKTWCLSVLATSPIASGIENLRIRIPNRSLLVPLTTTQTSSTTTSLSHTTVPASGIPSIFPSIEYLDLSTTYLPTESSYSTLLRRHQSLRHLILDRTGLLPTYRIDSTLSSDDRHAETSRSLGKATAAVGVVRAIEATRCWRALKKELEEKRTAGGAVRDRPPPSSVPGGSRATRKKPKGRSAFASEPKWKRQEAEAKRTASTSASESMPATGSSEPRVPRLSKIPSKLIIVPAPTLLRSLCAGVDIVPAGVPPSSDPARATTPSDEEQALRDEWNEAWEEGWRVGLDRLEEVVEEKVGEWSRTIAGWEREHPYDRPDSSSDEDDDGTREGRPRFVSFNPTAFDPSPPPHADPIATFLHSFRLVDTTPAQVRASVAEAMASRPCVFCTVPDCEGVGKVAWVDQGLHRWATLAAGEGSSEGSEAETSERAEVEVVDDEEDVKRWMRPESAHKAGCGHLVGRQIWDPDRW